MFLFFTSFVFPSFQIIAFSFSNCGFLSRKYIPICLASNTKSSFLNCTDSPSSGVLKNVLTSTTILKFVGLYFTFLKLLYFRSCMNSLFQLRVWKYPLHLNPTKDKVTCQFLKFQLCNLLQYSKNVYILSTYFFSCPNIYNFVCLLTNRYFPLICHIDVLLRNANWRFDSNFNINNLVQ